MIFKKPDPVPGGKQSDLFIQLKDGGAVTFVPRGEVYEFFSVFGTRGPVLPGTPGARARYKINAVVTDDGKTFKAKILEFGKQVYEQFYEIAQVCDVTKTKLRLSRKGTSRENTNYFLLPVMKEPLSPAQMTSIEAVTLHILDKDVALPSQPIAAQGDNEWPPGPEWSNF